MHVRHVSPILNVSDLAGSFAWFEKLGWTKNWEWCPPGGPASFGAVGSGEVELFLCLDGQGGRARDGGVGGDGQGVWLSLWVDDVDAVHTVCVREQIEVLREPRDETWGVRELLIRHPDGHVFRISRSTHVDDHEHPHDPEHDRPHEH
jgi:hypothetical protein